MALKDVIKALKNWSLNNFKTDTPTAIIQVLQDRLHVCRRAQWPAECFAHFANRKSNIWWEICNKASTNMCIFTNQIKDGICYKNLMLMNSGSTLPYDSLSQTLTHTHLSTHPYKMGLNSYQMVPFPHSSWKHFLPKIVLSSAFGQGHWRCCDWGLVSFHHRGGRRCQVLHGQEKGGVLGSGEGTFINGGPGRRSSFDKILDFSQNKKCIKILVNREWSSETNGKVRSCIFPLD